MFAPHIRRYLAAAALLVCLNCTSGRSFGDEGGDLISNGDFETPDATGTAPAGWGRLGGALSWGQENGNHFLRITSIEPGKMAMLYRVFKIPPGVKALQFSWRQRVTNLKVGAKPWFDARILLSFKDAAGKDMPQKLPPLNTRTNGDWESRYTRFLVPDGAVGVVFMPALFQVESGTFDLDDLSLKPTDPGPLQAAAEADKASIVPAEEPIPAKWPKELHVDGKQVLDKDGKPVWLQGVNIGGMESVASDTHIMKSAVVAVDEWRANIVRLPISEEFWFGRSPYQQDEGAAYRALVDKVVNLVANRGAYLLLDLHRYRAPAQSDVDFWKDAAAHFKNHPAVLFDLFNEPHDVSWDVWKNGGFVDEKKPGVDESAFLTEAEKIKANAGFHSVGMQALIDIVRGIGARNIVIAGGLAWSGDLSGIIKGYALDDKGGNGIIYGWHNYNWHKDWQHRVLDTAGKYPIFVGEVGADIKKMPFIPAKEQEDPYTWVPDMLGFIQKYKLNWTAWCLHPQATPVLISNWNYTPSPFWGVFVKRALAGEQFELKAMR